MCGGQRRVFVCVFVRACVCVSCVLDKNVSFLCVPSQKGDVQRWHCGARQRERVPAASCVVTGIQKVGGPSFGTGGRVPFVRSFGLLTRRNRTVPSTRQQPSHTHHHARYDARLCWVPPAAPSSFLLPPPASVLLCCLTHTHSAALSWSRRVRSPQGRPDRVRRLVQGRRRSRRR